MSLASLKETIQEASGAIMTREEWGKVKEVPMKDLKPGDIQVNDMGHKKVVKDVHQAVSKGYVVITYVDRRENGGGHGENTVKVLKEKLDEDTSYKVGDRVRHIDYNLGNGEVVAVNQKMGISQKYPGDKSSVKNSVKVKFDNGKILLCKKSNLGPEPKKVSNS